jgi:hypothetical protein
MADTQTAGGYFSKKKQTMMKAGKSAKATEARKSIPKDVRGVAVLNKIEYREDKDGNSPRINFAGNAITPEEYEGYGVYPTFWLLPGEKGNKTEEELIAEMIGALIAVAPDMEEEIRGVFANGKTGEIDKLFVKIAKQKPQFLFSTWGDKRVNYNFDGVPSEEEAVNNDDGGTEVNDGDDDGSGDDNSDGSDDGSGDDNGEYQDDGSGDDNGDDNSENEPGFSVGDEVQYVSGKKVNNKLVKVACTVNKIDTEAKTAKLKTKNTKEWLTNVPWSKIEA